MAMLELGLDLSDRKPRKLTDELAQGELTPASSYPAALSGFQSTAPKGT